MSCHVMSCHVMSCHAPPMAPACPPCLSLHPSVYWPALTARMLHLLLACLDPPHPTPPTPPHPSSFGCPPITHPPTHPPTHTPTPHSAGTSPAGSFGDMSLLGATAAAMTAAASYGNLAVRGGHPGGWAQKEAAWVVGRRRGGAGGWGRGRGRGEGIWVGEVAVAAHVCLTGVLLLRRVAYIVPLPKYRNTHA
jgi:hypothetical protein